jgi:phosphoglycolate phosphatase
MGNPTVIFDFDGTLADTFVTSIRIFERLTHRNEQYDSDEIAHLRGLTALHVIRELRIPPWRVPWLLVRGRAMMRKELASIVLFDGIEPVLQELQEAGIAMYIMSSNSPGTIRKVMAAEGLGHYFTHIYGNVGVFGKARMLRRVLARNQLTRETAVYVGDEGRDVEAAKRVGIKSIAVGWGFNSAELLARHHPYALVESIDDLAAVLLAATRDAD